MKKFLIRAIIGMLLVFCINSILTYQGISLKVGLNVITFLTSGALGFPGVALLYGILALEIL